jgi:hypothetical protein
MSKEPELPKTVCNFVVYGVHVEDNSGTPAYTFFCYLVHF